MRQGRLNRARAFPPGDSQDASQSLGGGVTAWAAGAAVALERMAGTTRLELATSAVTGQRSNRLNYVPAPWFLDGGRSRI
jgi:hypothetical protein